MPFLPFTPRTYSAASIRMHAPSVGGVYGITSANEWIFIGSTENIRASLLLHVEQRDSEMGKHAPTGFVFEVCDRSTMPGRHERLTFEYAPTVNRKGGGKR